MTPPRRPSANIPRLAKLTPPTLPKIVPRPRLFRDLDRAGKRPIVWITAPPGAGKTTLVASYLQAKRIPPLWYTLDERDGDLATFFHHLGMAVPSRGRRARSSLPHLTPEYLQGVSIFTRNFFEALEARLPPIAALVFDNYQTVPADSPLHEILALGLAHLGPRRPVLILSRDESPSTYAALRLSQRLAIIDGSSLRLTTTESRAIISQYHGKRLTPEQIRRVVQAGESLDGWMAGLVLLLEETTTLSTPVADLAGSRQTLFDYLGTEVFDRMQASMQDVLLHTAWCPSVTEDMAATLSGHTHAGTDLQQLYRRRYFIERRDGSPVRYVYHPLLQDFLRARLTQQWPAERVRQLQSDTALQLSAAGQIEEAVEIAIQTGDSDVVAQAVVAQAPSLLSQGRFTVIHRWLEAIPSERKDHDPWLLYWSACATPPATPEVLEKIAEKQEQAYHLFVLRGDTIGQILSWCGIVKAISNTWDRLDRLDPWFAIGLEWHAQSSSHLPAAIRFDLLSALLQIVVWRQGGSPLLLELREELDCLIPHVDNPIALAEFMTHLQIADGCLGDPSRSLATINTVRAKYGEGLPLLARLYLDHAVGHMLWIVGKFEEAMAKTDGILELCHSQGIYYFISWVAGQGVYPRLLLRRPDEAEQYVKIIRPHYDHLLPFPKSFFHYLSGWIAYVRGDVRLALRECTRCSELMAGTGCVRGIGGLANALAKVCHALGRDDEARAHLANIEPFSRNSQETVENFYWLLSKAELELDCGNEQAGLIALREGLAVGAKADLHFVSWWREEEGARLCARALEEQIEPAYVHTLISNLRLNPVGLVQTCATWPWAIKVYCLGRLVIEVNGKSVQFGRKIPRMPLALLHAIIAHGGTISTDTISDLLWPESDGDAAYRALMMALCRLRAMLKHKDAIVLKDNRLSLNSTLGWVDAIAFEQLAKDALHLLEKGKQQEGEQLVEKARALYMGEFLPNATHLPWTHPYRDRLARTATRLGAHTITVLA